MILRLMLFLLLTTTTMATAASALVVEVVLRDRVTHYRPMLRLADVADSPVDATEEIEQLFDTVLLPAPAPGTSIHLSASQIRDLLAAGGSNLRPISLRGATSVEVRRPERMTTRRAVVDGVRPSADDISLVVRQAIRKHLEQQAGGSGWKIEVELKPKDIKQLTRADRALHVRGGRPPWMGRQRFHLRIGSGEERIVGALVTRVQPAVFAKREIKRGDLVRRSDVEVRQHEGTLPRAVLFSLEQAVGQAAQRNIREGTIIQQSFVSAPLLVRRGETVSVFARTGGIAVQTIATARQDGAMGELIQIESAETKERFAAVVSGRRELEVMASGQRAGEFASISERLQR